MRNRRTGPQGRNFSGRSFDFVPLNTGSSGATVARYNLPTRATVLLLCGGRGGGFGAHRR